MEKACVTYETPSKGPIQDLLGFQKEKMGGRGEKLV